MADALTRIGQVKDDNITVVRVPGACELPVMTEVGEKAVNTTPWLRWEPIRGGTAHFEYVAGGASNGLGKRCP